MCDVLMRPVNGGLWQKLIVEHRSSNKLVADSILEGAVDLWTTAVAVEHLEHFYFPDAVHIELGPSTIDSH